ncbi:response regulator [Dechloromonas sp. ZY10]|uniref:response regulator transcription factor n=1 Tax=Dechloromonas aquae TaxID=2664436 RepID=UPI0035275060
MNLPRVLIADDDFLIRETLSAALADDFAVAEAASGEECLQWVGNQTPDLLLLDIEMPEMDGYEVCRRLRSASYDFPVIFVSAHDSLAEQLRGFDAGADDFVTKPFNAEVLFRQVQRAIDRHRQKRRLAEDREALQSLASDVLRDLRQTDVLLNFMRQSIGCGDYRELARNLLAATQAYGLACHVQVRHPEGAVSLTAEGPASAVELGVFAQCAGLGRSFRFSRRLIVNCPSVSLLLLQTPDDEALTDLLQERLAMLAESAEAITETIGVRHESASRAEALQYGSASSYQAIEVLRDEYRAQQSAAREKLQQMVNDVEDSYVFLGLTERQEATVSDSLRRSADEVLSLFQQDEAMEAQFSLILDALQPQSNGADNVMLF